MAMASPFSSPLFFFFFLFVVLISSPSSSQPLPPDLLLLIQKIKPALNGNRSDNLLLASWNATVPVCQWRGLKWALGNGTNLDCRKEFLNSSIPGKENASLLRDPSLQVVSVLLPAAGLSGEVPPELSQLSSLRSLFLRANSLSGSIPAELGNSPSLSEIDLGRNMLSGAIPSSIWNLCGRLSLLQLDGNRFSSEVPIPAFPNVSCPNLHALNLAGNRFSGRFPGFLAGFTVLKELDLGNNLFYGELPASSLIRMQALISLNLSHNNFTGIVPRELLSRFGGDAFTGNPVNLAERSHLSPRVIAGLVISSISALVVLGSVSVGWYQRRKMANDEEWEEEDEVDQDAELVIFQGGEHLTADEILNASGQVVAKTSYGAVYKAKLGGGLEGSGGVVSLRLLKEGSCIERDCCLSLVRGIGRVRHENLVSLRAFYQGEKGEKLLIYDCLPRESSLHDLLHENRPGKPTLSWARRHKIALGIARGLHHLHSCTETPLIHGSLMSENILVDEYYVARLTEFGVHKLLIPAVAEEMVTTMKAKGYKAPELQKMNKCNGKTDVYSFGIILLEILLGRKPGKDEGVEDFVDLPTTVKTAVLEEKVVEVFDAEILRGLRSPMEDGLVQALRLAMGCCAPVSSVRPAMAAVVKQLEENRPRNRSALYSPTETRSGMDTPF